MEPTERAYSYYDDPIVPLPPPPPMPPKRRRWVLPLSILLAIGIINVLLVGYLVGRQSLQPTATPTPISRATPTLDARVGVLTDDFPRFLKSFAILLSQHDYATIQGIVDTNNFQWIFLGISSGPNDWNDLNEALTSGQESLMISSPPLTPSQVGDTCQNYDPSSFAGYPVDALALKYAVGTSTLSDTSTVPQRPPDDDVFVFELPYGPSSYWTWRALTENNSVAYC